MNLKKTTLTLVPAMTALLLAGCSDYDNGFDDKTIGYNQTFQEVFGTISSDQDWNAATRVTATVNLDESVSGTMNIYTQAPTVEGCEHLATLTVTDGQGSITFDAPKDNRLLYACVKNSSGIVSSGYYIINGSTVSIGAEGQAGTRAASSVTKETYSYSAARMPEAAVAELLASGKNTYADFTDESGNQKYYWYSRVATPMPNLYKLNGVDFSQHDGGYSVAELRPIFNTYTNKDGETKDGVFKEQVDHIAQYVKTGVLSPDITLTVEETGEVTLDCMWRGTGYDDFFGYYYYTEGETLTPEKLWNINKYILIDEESGWVQKASSLTQMAIYSPTLRYDAATGTSVIDQDAWADYNDLAGMDAPSQVVSQDEKTLMRGTILKLTYFGADGNGTPTTTFPKGTKIGFFTCHKSKGRVFFSDCKLNYQLTYTPYTSPADESVEDNDQARPYAVKFTYNGRTYLGFGDEMGDCDNNDIVFIANNVETTPEEDITPEDLPLPEDASWVIACEDLGGSFDFDFNDVVFRVTHVSGETTATITPLASGGTLPVYLYYNNGATRITNREYHQLWGEDRPSNVTINASTRGSQGATISFPVDADYTVSYVKDGDNMGGIQIHVVQNGEDELTGTTTIVQAPDKGTTPQMILIHGTDWAWPIEFMNINTAYSDFASFVSTGSPVNWYNTYKDGTTVGGGKKSTNSGNSNNNSNSGTSDNNSSNDSNNSSDDNTSNDNTSDNTATDQYGRECTFTADDALKNFTITSDALKATGITTGSVTLTFVGKYYISYNEGMISFGHDAENNNYVAYAASWGSMDGCSISYDRDKGTVTVVLSEKAYADVLSQESVVLRDGYTEVVFVPTHLYIQ